MEIKQIIEGAIRLSSKVLKVAPNYQMADIKNSSKESIELVVASFVKEKNIIVVNPKCLEAIPVDDEKVKEVILFSNICHECFHAYQWKNDPKLFNEYKTIKEYGLNYADSELEIEAYGFQEAVLKLLYENINVKLDLSKLSLETQQSIHEKGLYFFNKYFNNL